MEKKIDLQEFSLDSGLDIRIVRDCISENISSIIDIDGGDVHYVYRIVSKRGFSYYLKIRKGHCRKYQDIKLDPTDIFREISAIQKLGTLFPDKFPQLIHSDEKKGFFLMSDVMPDGGASLLDLFNSGDNKQDDKIEILGKCIGEIHRSLSDVNLDDTRLDGARLKSRIKQIFSGTKLFSSGTFDAGIATHQYVLGDLSPKNIGFKKIGQRTSPVFFDFEFFDLGSTSFEVAFFCAHIYLHFPGINGFKLVELFLLTYKGVVSDFKADNMFWIVFHGVIRYRLGIKPLKYPINIHDECGDRLLHESEDFLKTMAII